MNNKSRKDKKETLIEKIEKRFGKDWGNVSTPEMAEYMKELGFGSLSDLLQKTYVQGVEDGVSIQEMAREQKKDELIQIAKKEQYATDYSIMVLGKNSKTEPK